MDKVKRTDDEKRQVLKRIRALGRGNIMDGCKAEGIAPSQFYTWQKKLGSAAKQPRGIKAIVYKADASPKKTYKKKQPVAQDATQKIMLVWGDVDQILEVFRGISK